MNDFGSQNGSKMEPKWRETKWRQLPRGHPKTVSKYRLVFCDFGMPLGPFWHPFRGLLGILGAFWPPSGSLLGSLRLSFRQPLEAFRSAANLPRFRRELAEIPPRTCRGSAENLPRIRRELAEVPSRICQEPAKNPPYELQAKLPFTLRLFRMDCVLRQTL